MPGSADPPVLESSRLRLRALVAGDAEGLLALFGDPEVVRYYDLPLFRSTADAEVLVEEGLAAFRAGSSIRWAVTHKGEGDGLVGTVSLHGIHHRHRYAELGYAVLRERWRQGIAREAVGLVVDAAFSALRLNRLEAFVDPRNEGSSHLLSGLGFSCEGRLRGRFWDGAQFHDDLVYSILPTSGRAEVGAPV